MLTRNCLESSLFQACFLQEQMIQFCSFAFFPCTLSFIKNFGNNGLIQGMRKGENPGPSWGRGRCSRVPGQLELGDADKEVKQWDTAELRTGSNSSGGMGEQQGCP